MQIIRMRVTRQYRDRETRRLRRPGDILGVPKARSEILLRAGVADVIEESVMEAPAEKPAEAPKPPKPRKSKPKGR